MIENKNVFLQQPLKETAEEVNFQQIEAPEQKKSKFDAPLFCLCFTNFLLNAAVSVITPFYPPLAEQVGLTVAVIGYVFSINPVGSFMFSILIGKKMSSWGRKKCLLLGLFSQVITIVAFGLLQLIQDNYTAFLAVSLLTRFIQGMSRAAYAATSFAYVPILWPKSIQQKISIMESLTGLGLMAGPFLGAVIFKYVGYQITFYIMGGLFSLTIIPTILYLPEDHQDTPKELSFKVGKVIGERRVFLLCLLVMMTSAGTTYLNPMFTIHMQSYGKTAYQSSFVLGSLTVAYVFSILFVPSLCKVMDKKYILTIGCILASVGDLIIAPLSFLPNVWWITLVGLPIIGIANSLCVLPSIPQMIEFIVRIFPQPQHKRSITDLASGLFVSSYSMGILLGPTVGGQTYQFFVGNNSVQEQQIAFRNASICMAGIQIFIAIIFFLFADGFYSLLGKQQKVNDRKEDQRDGRSIHSDLVYSDVGGTSVYDDDSFSKKLSVDEKS